MFEQVLGPLYLKERLFNFFSLIDVVYALIICTHDFSCLLLLFIIIIIVCMVNCGWF